MHAYMRLMAAGAALLTRKTSSLHLLDADAGVLWVYPCHAAACTVHQELSYGGNLERVRVHLDCSSAPGFPVLMGMDLLPDSLKAPGALVLVLTKQQVHPVIQGDQAKTPPSSAACFGELRFTSSEGKASKRAAGWFIWSCGACAVWLQT